MKRIIGVLSIILFIFLFPLIGLYIFCSNYYTKEIKVKSVNMDKNNNIVITLNKDGKCKIIKKWINSKNKICTFSYTPNIDTIFLKNEYNYEFKYKINKKFTVIKSVKINNPKMYLAINGSEKLDYKIDSTTRYDGKVSFLSDNPSIAKVDENGVVTGLSDGTTSIRIKVKDKEDNVEVLVTSLIQNRNYEYNFDREYLKCNQYTKEQNDLLDEILKARVNKVGFKTRASVVEAARFIALEFPYRIAYFSENGRFHPYGVTSKVDGEGRYYHEGLYLNDSRYDNVSPVMHGPGTWGCNIYSNPSEGYRANGFDCSGFISWIILNGGFDSEDVGAGVSSYKDLTDLGEKLLLTDSISNNKIKAGDLLSGQKADGGHIALVAGFKDGYYFVAESLWFGTGYFGSLIRKYDANELKEHFYWHVDLDNYYQNDGDYTDYWIN